jgi:hypothetical protein
VQFGSAKLQKQKWHGCHFCAAQAIEAEFFAKQKIGADSAVFLRAAQKNAPVLPEKCSYFRARI